MGMQLTIESFLLETFIQKVREKVTKTRKAIYRFICHDQLWIPFPKDDKYVERWRAEQPDGTFVWRERTLNFSGKSHGHVGSPVPMRKIKKDTPYLEGI